MFDLFKNKPEKLIKREQKWLIGEYSFLQRLKKAIKERNEKEARYLFRLISRYELRLERYHHKVIDAIKAIRNKTSGEYLQKINKLEEDLTVFEAELKRTLSRYGGSELDRLIKTKNWAELEKICPKIEQAVQGWFLLDKRIIEFEKELYEQGGENAELVYFMIRELEKNPDKIKEPGFIQKIVSLVKKRDEIKKKVIEKLSILLRRLRITSRTIVIILLIRALIGLLTTHDEHITMEKIERIIGKDFYVMWSSKLPEQQRNKIVDEHIQKNKQIIEEQLNKLLMVLANDVYNSIIDEIYNSYIGISSKAKRKGINIPLSRDAIEKEFLASLEKTKSEVISTIYFTLSQYYRLDILIEKLPGFYDGLNSMFKADFGGIWYNLRWGSFEPNFKIKLEDRIRRQTNTFLEPYLNEIKEQIKNEIKNKLVPKDVIAKTLKLLKTTIIHPTQIGQAINELFAELARTGMTYFFLFAFILAIGFFFPTTKILYKLLLKGYLKDLKKEIEYISKLYLAKK